MMTVGRAYQGPRRNWQETCDYCGVIWHRHELILDENGFLACPDDREGRTEQAIDYERAIAAAAPSIVRGKTRTY